MNGKENGIPVGAVLLGQPRQQGADGNAVAMTMYVHLVPELALLRIARGYDNEAGITEPATPRAIAAEAKAIVEAALEAITVRKE